MVVRRNDGDLSTLAAKVVDEHQGCATDAVDGTKGFGAEEDSFALESSRELGEVMVGV